MAFGTVNPIGPTVFSWAPVEEAKEKDAADTHGLVTTLTGDDGNKIVPTDDIKKASPPPSDDDDDDSIQSYSGSDSDDDDWAVDSDDEVDSPRSHSAPPAPPPQTDAQRKAAMYANRIPAAWTGGGEEKVYRRPIVKDLTEKVEEGTAGTVYGRDKEVEQIIRMMGQPKGGIRPILAGAEGIGKMSIAKKLAARLQEDDCPEFLKGHRVIMVDGLALMSQQPSAMGTDRAGPVLQMIIERTIRATEGKCIFFFRDMDKIISYNPVKTYLKSYFRKGLPCFASVSAGAEDEAVKKVQKAFRDRNFVTCPVEEVSKPIAKKILIHKLEKHPHPDGITVSDAALDTIIDLADAYIHNRPNPVKAYHLAFEAQNRVAQLRAKVLGAGDGAASSSSSSAAPTRRPRPAKVTPADVAAIVSEKTGISASSLATSDWEFLDNLEERFRSQIIGQDHAIKAVSERIQSCKIGLRDPNKPWATFMFMGPTGVGKTELAKLIAKELFNDANGLLRLDMSEYAESYTISKLLGSPPGYVGHYSGGTLTEALKKKKHLVILLDEIEKAHPEVIKTFLQVFNDGRLTDRQGETVDCTGCVFLMTSNIAATQLFENPTLTDGVKKELRARLSPEFCNRLTKIIPFKPLQADDCDKVIEVHLGRLEERYKKDFELCWTAESIDFFIDRGIDPENGHRGLCREVELEVERVLTEASRLSRCKPRGKVVLDVVDGELVALMETDKKVEAASSSS